MMAARRLDFCLLMVVGTMLCSEYLSIVKVLIGLKFIALVLAQNGAGDLELFRTRLFQ